MRFMSFLILSLIILISPVQADIFVYEHPEIGVSASYPDTWRRVINQKPDTVLTVMAPGHGDFATCKIRVREDGRFQIYPHRYNDEIQRLHFSRDFLADYLSVYNDTRIHNFRDTGGLGRGYAGYAEVSYTPDTAPFLRKRGFVFAGFYADKVYIADCAADAERFKLWARPFLRFIKSIDFQKVDHELVTGHYRLFLHDQRLNIRTGAREINRVLY